MYYVLFTKEADGLWYPQFGSPVKHEVTFERNEYRKDYKASALKIVKVADDKQVTTIAAQAVLNSTK